MKPKVSVLMPTYNDVEFIQSAIESVLTQVGVDIQLIVIDDGSDDGTDQFFQKIRDDRILYLRQENSGQLNALFRASRYVQGDFVCLVHSDDLVYDCYSFERNVNFINERGLDGCYSNIVTMDESGRNKGWIFVPKSVNFGTVVKVLRTLGSNVLGDFFFVKKDVYFKSVLLNYVLWNMPYWFSSKMGRIQTLKLGYINKPWYRYRIYSGNYLRNELGRFEAFNGVARTIIELSRMIQLRRIKLPYAPFLPGFFYGTRRIMKQNLNESDDIINSQISKLLKKYLEIVPVANASLAKVFSGYYNAVINSFSQKSDHILELNENDFRNFVPFFGKDARRFGKLLVSGQAPTVVYKLIEIAQFGAFTLVVPRKYEVASRTLQKFLNIKFKVRVED